jgi:hypothetical protein
MILKILKKVKLHKSTIMMRVIVVNILGILGLINTFYCSAIFLSS